MYSDLGTVYVAQDDNGGLVHNGGQALDVVIHTDTHWELFNLKKLLPDYFDEGTSKERRRNVEGTLKEPNEEIRPGIKI